MADASPLDAPIEVDLTGYELINTPLLNKGTAFTEAERDLFRLHGLLPPHVGSLEDQVARRLKVLRAVESDFARYAYLRDLQDTNETLFYALLVRNIEEMLPLVYTPTVGEGCQRFSEIWRKPRGVFLSYPNKHRIRQILADPRFDRVRVIVVSDGERILGLGDQGAGGMGIPIGKLALYTGCAGHSIRQVTLPVLLDVGTNNQERLDDPIYIGWRHARVAGADMTSSSRNSSPRSSSAGRTSCCNGRISPGTNAARLLARYRDRLCTFNDDIQGTAAVAAATLMAAINVTGTPLTEQRIALLGAGSAGCGIAALLLRAMIEAGASEAEARRRFFAVDRHGLLVDGMPGITPEQAPFVQRREAVAGWTIEKPGEIGLLDVVVNAKPTVLIGVSGPGGRLHRGRGPHHGAAGRAAGHLSALQSHLAQRGDGGAARRLDRWPRAHRHRQPVRAGRVEGAHDTDRPDQQLLHLPGHGAWHPGRGRAAGHGRDVHGGRQGRRGNVADGDQQGGTASPARPRDAARCCGGGDSGRAPGAGRRRGGDGRCGDARPTHRGGRLGAALPALSQARLKCAG